MENNTIDLSLFHKVCNIDLSAFEHVFVNKSITKRMGVNHIVCIEEYFNFIKSNKSETDELIASLYIPYSEFFRNSLSFSLLENIVIPEIVREKAFKKNKEIRIWSMACADGQEVYSIAMLIEEFLSKTEAEIPYRIFATDIKQSALKKASKGSYTIDEVQNISLRRINNFFELKNNLYNVSSKLKKNVYFSDFDLLSNDVVCPEASIFGNFDIILCCNVLFYYNSFSRNTILNKVKNCLHTDGYLVTGEAERDIVSKFEFVNTYQSSAIFQNI